MAKFKDLLEWDYAGTRYSLYVKHFVDDDGRKGVTVLFEDITHEKVTEMVIPPRMFPAFLQAVNGGMERYRGLF